MQSKRADQTAIDHAATADSSGPRVAAASGACQQ